MVPGGGGEGTIAGSQDTTRPALYWLLAGLDERFERLKIRRLKLPADLFFFSFLLLKIEPGRLIY